MPRTAAARPVLIRPLHHAIWALHILFAAWRRCTGLARQRQALADLDDRLLDDIGLDRATADREAGRMPWDAPCHWYDRRF